MDLIFQDGIASNSHLVEEIDTKRKRKRDIIAVASYFQVSSETIEWQQHLKCGVDETGVSMIGQSVIRKNKSFNYSKVQLEKQIIPYFIATDSNRNYAIGGRFFFSWYDRRASLCFFVIQFFFGNQQWLRRICFGRWRIVIVRTQTVTPVRFV